MDVRKAIPYSIDTLNAGRWDRTFRYERVHSIHARRNDIPAVGVATVEVETDMGTFTLPWNGAPLIFNPPINRLIIKEISAAIVIVYEK